MVGDLEAMRKKYCKEKKLRKCLEEELEKLGCKLYKELKHAKQNVLDHFEDEGAHNKYSHLIYGDTFAGPSKKLEVIV